MFDDCNAHMGHVFLSCMKQRPDAVCQIDAATDQQETNSSVLRRTVRLARCFRRLGLTPGDVLVLSGRNHLDLHIPYYAANLNGMPIAPADPLYKLAELRTFFKLTAPKIAFCDEDQRSLYIQAAAELALDTKIVAFTGDNSMKDMVDSVRDEDIEGFQPAVIDPEKSYGWLVSTGGTTGVIKLAAITHSTWRQKFKSLKAEFFKSRPLRDNVPNVPALNLSPVQWISGLSNALAMPVNNQTKIMTSAPATVDHVIDIINKYRPVTSLIGPSLATGIIKSQKHCDLTCFNVIFFTGGKVFPDMLHEVKKRVRSDTILVEAYGQTENLGPVLGFDPNGPIGNCGRPLKSHQVKLVNPETGHEVTEANVPGELWTKGLCFSEYYNNPEETGRAFTDDGWFKTGDLLYRDENSYYFFVERLTMLIKYRNYHLVNPETGHEVTEANVPGELWTKGLCFSEYYNNPEETGRAFTDDGWFKTGDLLYRDENSYYFFVERLTMLIKYRNYHIAPPELEEVIRSLPGVLEVSVTSIPHEEDGEHPVACVVRRPGCDVTARAIKDCLAENLSETKQLRGGVIFMDQLPMTSSGKVARGKLKQLVLNTPRE